MKSGVKSTCTATRVDELTPMSSQSALRFVLVRHNSDWNVLRGEKKKSEVLSMLFLRDLFIRLAVVPFCGCCVASGDICTYLILRNVLPFLSLEEGGGRRCRISACVNAR
jgi:hypothetical protein